MPCNEVLVEVKGLKKYFQAGRRRVVKAVDDVSFRIYRGETLGLVGESGCGKTTCGKAMLGLLSLTEGEVVFDGMKVHRLEPGERKEFTKRAQIVYQDPYSSLNPRMTVKDIIGEGIEVHRLYRGKEQEERVCELLHTVGLNREHINRFPHEFSGGQRQRIGIARALANAGHNVVLVGRRGPVVEAAAAELGGGASAFAADVTDVDQLAALADPE